jgi:hypothetical protein
MNRRYWIMGIFVLLLTLGMAGGTWSRTIGAPESQTLPATATPTQVLPTATPAPTRGPDPTAVPEATATARPVIRYFYYEPIPLIFIEAVKRGEWVTIRTENFPKDTEFTARMGEYGTLGIDGEEVEVVQSEEGGKLEWTFKIPEGLAKNHLIAIRLESTTGYYSFNWFWNYDYP